MKNRIIYTIPLFLLIAVFSCREHYTLPAKAVVNTNFLVVEGNINIGQDSTIIRLSRVMPITDSTRNIFSETGASIVVESDAGGSYPLQALPGGLYGTGYISPSSPSEKFRLHIVTANSKEYFSDYVAFKKTPVIDSVSWEQHDDGVHIYANAHDDANNSKYYKWDFIETWEYHSSIGSCCKYDNGAIVPRTPADTPFYTCYTTIPSSAIIMQSTTNLANDVVYKKELMFIPTSTYKIGVLYSILVKQTVLTQQGFDFWNGLSKNTEQLGSLFDALPSQLQGNLHPVKDDGDPVIGFITATTQQQQRLWIKKVQVQNWAYPPGAYQSCDSLHVPDDPSQFGVFASGSYLVIDRVQATNPFSPWIALPVDCVDCRLKGGVLAKPPFWP